MVGTTMPATGNKSIISYRLSIRLCADGFSFLVNSNDSGQLLFCVNVHQTEGESLAESLERGLQQPRIKGRVYERVILYSTLPSTRLPLDEFRREDMLAVYRMTFAGTQIRYEDMRCQVLSALEVVEVFPLHSQVEQALHKYYPNALIQGIYGSMLERVAQMQQGSTMPVAFNVVLDGDMMLIAVLKNGRLSYANVFKTKRDADRLYYTLLVWKILELDTWHDHCLLYGATDEFQKMVGQYLYNIQTDKCVL